MLKKQMFTRAAIIFLLLMTPNFAQGANLEFSGFGDMTFGNTWGGPADNADAAQFLTDGTDAFPLSENEGFGNTGIDFVVLGELNDRLSVLSEVNLQLERGGSSDVGLDVERVYLDYRIHNGLNVQVGSFFTPIGFHNRTLYSRAWLMYSVQIPDFDEEELGFIPNHSTGVHVYGNLPTTGAHSLNYAVSLANSRGADPVTLILNRDTGERKTVTGLLEWVFPSHRDFRIGFSGWVAKLDTLLVGPAFGNTSDPTDTTNGTFPGTGSVVELEEMGVNPYAVLYSEHFNLILEYAASTQKDKLGNLTGSPYHFESFLGEISMNLMEDTLHPYVRYDKTALPSANGGPYLPLRDDGGVLTRHFIPNFEAVMVGVAYDLFALNRIKVELIKHLDGARSKYGINFQTAFAF